MRTDRIELYGDLPAVEFRVRLNRGDLASLTGGLVIEIEEEPPGRSRGVRLIDGATGLLLERTVLDPVKQFWEIPEEAQ